MHTHTHCGVRCREGKTLRADALTRTFAMLAVLQALQMDACAVICNLFVLPDDAPGAVELHRKCIQNVTHLRSVCVCIICTHTLTQTHKHTPHHITPCDTFTPLNFFSANAVASVRACVPLRMSMGCMHARARTRSRVRVYTFLPSYA
jgi:hypothetical protein